MSDKFCQLDLYGKKATERSKHSNEGNIVLGLTSRSFLMLDIDLQNEEYAWKLVLNYATFHKLGSILFLRSSKSTQGDLFGNRLGNYLAIFGTTLQWKEIHWHITELRRLGIINKSFAKLREFGSITIRVNAKNKKTRRPKVIRYYRNGPITGIARFVAHRNRCQDVGSSIHDKGEVN